jgi:mono/diheme cytochrome c family protein
MEGGAMAPFHSSMPAWKSILSEEQIWQIIAFIRTL